mgnify:CR=1 FL=1
MTVIDEQTRYKVITSSSSWYWTALDYCPLLLRFQTCITPLDKQCLKASTANLKAFNTLCHKNFDTKKEAQQALQEFESSLLFTCVTDGIVVAVYQNKKRGKPAKDAKPRAIAL